MRIISGNLKGKSLNYLKILPQGPLKDSVKESIFNKLKHSNDIKTNLENADILTCTLVLVLLVLNVFQEVQKR